jgi:thiol:disulfide interchange protein DsbC
MSSIVRRLLLVAALVTGFPAAAAEVGRGVILEGEHASTILARINAARAGMPVVRIAPSPVESLYSVELEDASTFYATLDGRHLIAGDLYEIGADGFVNRTEDLRAGKRLDLLDAVAEEDMIVFSAEGETKGVVSVFTDVDCGFCQRLHQEVPELNAMGIEVRYLAYPRAGIGSASADKLVSAWCAAEPTVALTRLKAGQPVEPRSCPNPVASQYRLGREMGVRGTPALFLEDGRYLPGYMPAHALAAELGVAVGAR